MSSDGNSASGVKRKPEPDNDATASTSKRINVGLLVPLGNSTSSYEEDLRAAIGDCKMDCTDDINPKALENSLHLDGGDKSDPTSNGTGATSSNSGNSEDAKEEAGKPSEVKQRVYTTRIIHDNIKGDLKQDGEDNITVHGQVIGAVFQNGSGKLIIYGNVVGKLCHNGTGSFVVLGNVTGSIRQLGAGSLKVYGNMMGNIQQDGAGKIQVMGRQIRGKVLKGGNRNGKIMISGEDVEGESEANNNADAANESNESNNNATSPD